MLTGCLFIRMETATPVARESATELTDTTRFSIWQAELRRQLDICNLERYILEDIPMPGGFYDGSYINQINDWELDRNLARAIILRSLGTRVLRTLTEYGIRLQGEASPKAMYDTVVTFMSFRKALGVPTHLDRLMNLKLEDGEQLFVLPRVPGDTDYQYYCRLFLLHKEKLEEGGCTMTDAATFQLFLEGLPVHKYCHYIDSLHRRVQRGRLSWKAFRDGVLNGTEVLGCSKSESDEEMGATHDLEGGPT